MSNKTKTCGECKHYIAEMYHCKKNDVMAEDFNTCEDFDPKVITNGEKIWDSGYDAVITFAKTWMQKFSCWAEAEAYLNAPAECKGKDE